MSEQSFIPGRHRIRGGFVERTVHGLASGLEHARDAERLSTHRGLMQGLDPRVKLVLCLMLILAGVLTHALLTLAGIFMTTTLLALASGVGVGRLAKQAWLAVFLFTGCIALPSLFIVPGETLARLPGLGWSISEQGARSAAFLLGRAQNSATACLLLILTTPWPHVLKALRGLGMPVVAVALLGMAHRYLFVLLHTAMQFFEARRSRLIAPMGRAQQRQLIAHSAGVLLEKSIQLSSEVHLAMISRGYRGEVHLMDDFRLRARDAVVLLCALPLFVLVAGRWI